MSWFGTDAVVMDERPRETVAEGVVMERRSLLRFSAATIAAGLAASCAGPSRRGSVTPDGPAGGPGASEDPSGDALAAEGAAPGSGGRLDIEEFLAEMYPRAQDFIRSGGEREESYLMAIGELMTRLRVPSTDIARSTMRAFAQKHGSEGPGFEMYVVMFDLEPGKGFTHHDHRDYNGVILGVEGEAHVTNYDILGDTLVPPKGETFQIRQTRDGVILPGRFSTLGTTRENVHDLIAGPDGATVLDVFTYLVPGARSYFMDVDPEPLDPVRRIYDAAWA